MSTNFASSGGEGTNGNLAPQTYFHTQRAALVNEIAVALDTTLTHLNRLNRSLESIIGIGNEFSNVEALWSQFEGVMGKDTAVGEKAEGQGQAEGGAVEEEKESALETPPVARTGMRGS